MKKGLVTWILTIAVMVMAIGGTTLAWFTATAPVIENDFTAGTVEIEADGEVGSGQVVEGNWNPGDETKLTWEIINKGSKSIYVRAKLDYSWIPNLYRLLVVYTGESIQLIAMEWDQAIPNSPADGYIAKGSFKIQYPVSSAYMTGVFSGLPAGNVLQNGVHYNLWCIDESNEIYINQTYNNVKVFDPISNPDWYNDVVVPEEWKNIPMDKIAFILNRNYMAQGYTAEEIQNAIWHFTNGLSVSGAAADIVAEANTDELPATNVILNLGVNWVFSNGYYYYIHPISGTYAEADAALRTIICDASLLLDGLTTGNEYQGRSLMLTAKFEAIQSSNGAVDDAWPGNPY